MQTNSEKILRLQTKHDALSNRLSDDQSRCIQDIRNVRGYVRRARRLHDIAMRLLRLQEGSAPDFMAFQRSQFRKAHRRARTEVLRSSTPNFVA
ncbi:hypothetical protein G3A40_37420 [Paraburkholderia aspalathi]|uniref:hypothetical protein n=1 Tax=Paraburkholderia aspalathi TaxID=1324617 RepID=UPI00190B3295|nr:hypothetical protein [Paraburkholderia aspalathi]MBK3865427.1 hypothetical protein [Paraburkholderia aspalathi]